MKMKKACATMMILGLLAAGTGTAWADVAYPDVDAGTVQGQAIVKMTEAGVVGGYEDGTFRPAGQLTRAEFVKIINGVFHYRETEEVVAAFDDVSGHWAQGQIEIAQQNGYIGGVGYVEGVGVHCFAPDATLTREQVAVILSRILKLENVFDMKLVLQDAVSDWAKADVEKAIVCGVFTLEDNNTFRATEPITRAEVCQALAPYVKTLTPVVQGEQKQVQDALQEASTALKSLHYTDAEMNQVVGNLQSSINKTLQAGRQGITITKVYVETNYAEEIKQTRRLYSSLSGEERQQLKTDIVNSMSLDALSVLYDYFLEEKTA